MPNELSITVSKEIPVYLPGGDVYNTFQHHAFAFKFDFDDGETYVIGSPPGSRKQGWESWVEDALSRAMDLRHENQNFDGDKHYAAVIDGPSIF